MSVVEIRAAVLEGIVSHARADAPIECCGLLIGCGQRIEERVPTRNALASPSRYLVDPREHFAILKAARAGGRAVLGAYHSHLHTEAAPSERDITEAHDPDLLYVIVSLQDSTSPVVRAYRIRSGEVTTVPFVQT